MCGKRAVGSPRQLMTWAAKVDYNAYELGVLRVGRNGGECHAAQRVDDFETGPWYKERT